MFESYAKSSEDTKPDIDILQDLENILLVPSQKHTNMQVKWGTGFCTIAFATEGRGMEEEDHKQVCLPLDSISRV